MTALEHDKVLFAPPPRGARTRFAVLAVLGAAVWLAYVAATIAGAPKAFLTPAINAMVIPVPVAVWWAFSRAPSTLRRPVCLLAIGATCWLIGSVVWEAFYLAGGNTVPQPPGVWDVFFIGAQLLVIAALIVAMRSLISVRLASLDTVVVAAAGAALAAPFVRRGLEAGVDAASITTLNRPILSIVILMLIASAALRSWEGVPLSMAMLALAEATLTLGNLVYAFEAVQNRYVDERWATLAWGAGAIVALLAASTIILGIDRPVRIGGTTRIPGHSIASSRVLLVSLGGLLLSCGVSGYGLATGSHGLAVAGLGACVAIGIAMAFRGTDSISTAEAAYLRLDRALLDTERARDDLARANAEIRTMQIAFADLLNLADERTEGRIRDLLEDAGQELAELLEDEMSQQRPR